METCGSGSVDPAARHAPLSYRASNRSGVRCKGVRAVSRARSRRSALPVTKVDNACPSCDRHRGMPAPGLRIRGTAHGCPQQAQPSRHENIVERTLCMGSYYDDIAKDRLLARFDSPTPPMTARRCETTRLAAYARESAGDRQVIRFGYPGWRTCDDRPTSGCFDRMHQRHSYCTAHQVPSATPAFATSVRSAGGCCKTAWHPCHGAALLACAQAPPPPSHVQDALANNTNA